MTGKLFIFGHLLVLRSCVVIWFVQCVCLLRSEFAFSQLEFQLGASAS
jgi:hypothetical protein